MAAPAVPGRLPWKTLCLHLQDPHVRVHTLRCLKLLSRDSRQQCFTVFPTMRNVPAWNHVPRPVVPALQPATAGPWCPPWLSAQLGYRPGAALPTEGANSRASAEYHVGGQRTRLLQKGAASTNGGGGAGVEGGQTQNHAQCGCIKLGKGREWLRDCSQGGWQTGRGIAVGGEPWGE